MKTWIRWWGLGLFVALGLVWYLCIDRLIEYGIETAGSKAVGAQVDVADTKLSLFSLRLELNGLAVTNPEKPMENQVFSEHLSLQLDSGRLLRRQVIVDDARVEGLKFNSPRTHSGAISQAPDAQTTESEDDSAGFDLPGIDLPDPKKLIAAEKDKIQAKLKSIENNLKSIETQWDERLATLPNKKTLDAYKARWKEIKKKSWLQKISGTKSLHSDVKADLKVISDLNDQLEKDIELVKAEVARAKALPEKEADRILADLGYGGGSRQLVKKLFGEQAKQWLASFTGLFQKASSLDQSDQEKAPERGEGQWVHFTELTPHPDFLIKHAKIAGEIDFQSELLEFEGVANDMTHQAKRWHKITTFAFKGGSKSGADFSAKGDIDLRKEPLSHLDLDFNKVTLKDLVLSGSKSMPISLTSSLLSGAGQVEIKNDSINLTSSSQFTNAEFFTGEQLSTTKQLLADALKSVESFNIDLGLEGNVEQPDMTFKSNLDNVLGKALKNQASDKISAYKKTFKESMRNEFLPELSSLDGNTDFLKKIEQQLKSKKADMQSISKGLF